MLARGRRQDVLLVGFTNPALQAANRQDAGRGRARCAASRPRRPRWTWSIEDDSRVGTIYFLMSEDNVRRQVRAALGELRLRRRRRSRPRALFLKSNPHPRAYGNFARLLGRYVRDEKADPAARRRSAG